jgi:hypothetical protein
MKTMKHKAALAAALLCAQAAHAVEIKGETVSGNFDSTVSIGTGIRLNGPACDAVIGSVGGSATPLAPSGPGAPAGCADLISSYNDQGNLNYARHDRFTTYLKGTHELLLNFPDDIKFLGRVSWLRDFSATHTSGIASGTGGPAPFADDARDDLRQKTRLLDLWVSKSFAVGDQRVRVRVGNQVVNWGESMFIAGGLNQTNAVDLMRLAQPGTQLKEAVLPAPMINVSSGLGHGLSIEGYVQEGWNDNYFPPVGSYWSTAAIGKGASDYGVPTADKPRKSGQYGVALRYQPDGTQLNLGLYAVNYHDKSPVLITSATSGSGFAYHYLEDRKMFGVSANFPLGNWAIGTELSYRPHDAVSLNASAPGLGVNSATATTGARACLADGTCYVEQKKFQWHVTGLLSLTPGDNGALLHLLGADTGTLLAEAVVIRYPDLQPSYQGVPVAAGGWGWGYATTADVDRTGASVPTAVGTRTSYGYNFDFSWVYDGTLIPGWQVVPEIYFFQAVKGRTPNLTATFMQGAKSANFTVGFIQNPANWQVSLNYARFWGGSSIFDQPLRDRSFVGLNISRNF